MVWKEYAGLSGIKEAEDCPICCVAFSDSCLVRETNCQHVFHQKCLVKWIMTKLKSGQTADCP